MGRRRPSRSEEDAAPPAERQPQPQLPWGMEKTEMQPSSLTALTDDKLARFVLGHQKKTKFQKEREDREAKKRQADEEAAKIYATFVASFDNEDETKGKAFVRGGAQESGDVYRLRPNEPPPVSKKVPEVDTRVQEVKHRDVEQLQKPRKRRAIDEFLEEMKERGPAPVAMDGAAMTKGSFDTGDPETTNLYVGNLAPTVTEELLEKEFGRYGDVYSVKIMWPRSEEERARRRNCGFVSFYERRDADDARVNLDNKELEGQPIIVGWGKAVKIQPRARAPGVLLPAAVTPTSITAPTIPSADVYTVGTQTIAVEIPADESVKRRVDHLARYVAADGQQFENAVRMREANNKADYGFLFEPQSSLALYYRWRVYSFAMGDEEYSWRGSPFQMTAEGPMWVPPKTPSRSQASGRQGSSSRSSGRSSYRDRGSVSPRRRDSKSPSSRRSRSRTPSPSPRKSRRRRGGSRRRSRSSSESSVDSRDDRKGRRCRYRSRSRSRGSRGRRSRSFSSDESSPRKRSRRSRSRSRREDRRHGDNSHDRSRDRRHFDSRAGRESATVGKDQKLLTGQQLARARDLERGRERNRLSSEDYDDFKELIAALTLERESVKKTMGFALDNSEAAVDLVNISLESFKSSAASGVTLIGLLYVTSDILHNSSAAVKNASLFRTTFQECLPEIMDTLRVAHKNIIGRMSANAMKEKVMNVLNAWESWSLFPPAVLVGLHATFLRKMEEDEYIATHSLTLEGIGEADLERLRKTCRQAGILASGDVKQLGARLHWLKAFTSPTATSAPAPTMAVKKPSTVNLNNVSADEPKVDTNDTAERKSEKVDEEDRENLDGEPIDEEDLDGDPIDEEPSIECSDDVDGALMDDEALDAEPLDGDVAEDELDGEPLADEDLDGAPMDEDDLDGEPI
ncbi:hypothetical protein PF010_g15103 [Phytophthora fragariae]|uniref:U2 snRNP-associated SURP motif-containing protein n=1 Tax=Phytophthora fragariae TaxID=53985 RepID=A0A6G0KVJ4_9STRA|nr:hypothetical protein PF010_g15103 [Phytophthora fragariae]